MGILRMGIAAEAYYDPLHDLVTTSLEILFQVFCQKWKEQAFGS